MSSTHSGLPKKVDDMLRNQWTASPGISGRHAPDFAHPKVKIIAMTAFFELLNGALDAGADLGLYKSYSATELVNTIRGVYSKY